MELKAEVSDGLADLLVVAPSVEGSGDHAAAIVVVGAYLAFVVAVALAPFQRVSLRAVFPFYVLAPAQAFLVPAVVSDGPAPAAVVARAEQYLVEPKWDGQLWAAEKGSHPAFVVAEAGVRAV